jgi:DNA-binding CsgD family transcriptional regulator
VTTVTGREGELVSVERFVAGLDDGAAALVLEGEAGVGKTTLWVAGVEEAEARGCLVLEARPAESETALSFSGLGDILGRGLEDALEALPATQRRALTRARVREDDDGPPPDPHAVGVALLNTLRALAAERPVLVAVDDAPWLDDASSAAVSFAARRLRDERVGLLLSGRSGLDCALFGELKRSLGPGRCAEIELGPLDTRALGAVVQEQLGTALPRPLLTEVHQAAGGNPFYALEIVRTLQRSGAPVEAGHPLPVPESLHELVHGRLLALPPESRDFLLAAAAHAHPTVAITEAASGVTREAGLPPALEARIIELDRDRIRFTHPLLAAGAYETAAPLRRAEVHRRLAELLSDPEARAWQLAASVDEPDETVAAALEGAAQHARARGAPRPAALLLDRACELTPKDRPENSRRRAVDGAFLHFESGDSRRAETQLRDVIAMLPIGTLRGAALTRLARVRSYESQADAADLYLQAIDEADGDPEILAVAHDGVASSLFRLRERLGESVEHAELAARLALEIGDDALAAETLGTRLLPETLLGLETAQETAERASALQAASEGRRALAQPRFAIAARAWWTDGLEEARSAFLAMLERARESGDESSLPYILYLLGQVECTLGDLEGASARAGEGRALSEQAGQKLVLSYHLALEALVEAELGHVERARSAAESALALVAETGGRPAELVATAALGRLDLALGDAAAASARLEPIVSFARQEHHGEPAASRFVVDLVEALIEQDRGGEAGELLDWYEADAQRLDRTSALANCARCRGLLAARAGDVETAIAAYGAALALHLQVEIPVDRGRTLLALGAAQRRLKHRREARETLGEALELFERIGAAAWAERVHAELKRISGRAASPGALTPAEERVAALVADGKTNKEVAAALFLSDRTVEGHLARVFGKLGIRHRTELPRALTAVQTQGTGASSTGDSPVSAGPPAP